MKYYLEFGTGAGDEFFEGTLEEAKAEADEGAAYTQCDYCIKDVNEKGEPTKEICFRPWWGVEYNPEEDEDEDVITFGKFGYFGAWKEAE